MIENRHGGGYRSDKKSVKDGVMNPPGLLTAVLAIESILHSMNVDWSDKNFTETPERVAKAMVNEWFVGYSMEAKQVLTTFDNEKEEKDMVIVSEIPFYSMCAHHMAPFTGKAAIAYVPNGKVVGLSKLPRLVDVYARRLQLQEHITKQVADSFCEVVHPRGVMVVLYDVIHNCVSSRGIKAHGTITTTSAVRGVFEDSVVRSEALSLMGLK